MGKRKKTAGRKELISIHYHVVSNVIMPSMLIRHMYLNNLKKIAVTTHNGARRCLSATDILRVRVVTKDFDYNDYIKYLCSFIEKCVEKDKTKGMYFSNTDMEEYIKSFATDQRYSKEFDSLLDDYFRIKSSLDVQKKMQLTRNRAFYQCLVSQEKNYIPERLKCLDRQFQCIRNISESSKSLMPSSNFNHIKPTPHLSHIGNRSSNNISSGVIVAFTISVFCIIFVFFYKFANKILHRNENMDRNLSIIRLKDKKACKSSVNPCSKLENCLRSCEKNYKRGY
ncbi:MAG: hypothetical protein sL5_04430 [Candidatus Mesenet longicola]|uniref:Uncharacterized protein n=1 Tax=Candidatus Mesenet longicola TaxID=1892558 RepID=A0A8J3MP15_9RICK|nr:MAG: hypothetical protein sGL2_04540 [Candidatus Mesenet longicola]GHM59450.1 MAG: hypothetical protein sL5_04430 [Candidatus Mesenet longicola]